MKGDRPMNTKSKTTGTIVRRILIFGLASILMSILMCMLAGCFILNGFLRHDVIPAAAIVISFLSVFMSAYVCVKLEGQKCVPIAVAVAAVYTIICLLLKGLFFREDWGQTAYLIPASFAASAAAGVLGAKKKKRKR